MKIPTIVLSRNKCARNFQAQLYYFVFNTLTETAYYQKHKNVATQKVDIKHFKIKVIIFFLNPLSNKNKL